MYTYVCIHIHTYMHTYIHTHTHIHTYTHTYAIYIQATAAIYDEPVVLQYLTNDYYGNGLCGSSGGLCEKK